MDIAKLRKCPNKCPTNQFRGGRTHRGNLGNTSVRATPPRRGLRRNGLQRVTNRFRGHCWIGTGICYPAVHMFNWLDNLRAPPTWGVAPHHRYKTTTALRNCPRNRCLTKYFPVSAQATAGRRRLADFAPVHPPRNQFSGYVSDRRLGE